MGEKRVSLHGATVQVPDGWEEWSVFRFVSPAPDVTKLPPQLRVKAAAPGGASSDFETNVMVSRHRRPGTPLANIFEEVNAKNLQRLPAFKVLRGGSGAYLGQQATWQDLTFLDYTSGKQMFQRQVAVQNPAGEFVVLTLTVEGTDLDTPMTAFGFERSAC